jgi:hypothetical protein
MKPLTEITDYKEAAEILASEFDALGWHKTNVVGGHLLAEVEGWKYFAWEVIFCPPSKAPVSLAYKCGVGHVYPLYKNEKTQLRHPFAGKPKPPAPAEVLACYCRDWTDSNCAFDEWADTFGYDTDSRKALSTYEQCREAGPKLRALGLSRAQIERFAGLSALL